MTSDSDLISWFIKQGGTIDTKSIGFTHFPGQGKGAVALQDIPDGQVLFSIPYDLALTTRTSSLPRLFGETTWREFKLHEGWSGLMLCMMWEAAQGERSRWSAYLESLPSIFDTPMFWSDEDLAELKGTAIENKIGRTDAESNYHEKVIPAMQSRADLFATDKLSSHYSLEQFHIMGSRILSRSFNVGEQNDGDGDDDDADETNKGAAVSEEAMDVDSTSHDGENEEIEAGILDEEDSDSDEDDEDPADIAMLPMADMLNARYGCENAKLFYEKDGLKMTTTKTIPKGEQIWNTYGNPPNSDLLRRYGHVDLLTLPDGQEGNPANIVEILADCAVDAVKRHSATQHQTIDDDAFKERIDWWLENGGEDVFLLEMDCVAPKSLISFVRLLTSTEEWQKARGRDKFPKAKLDESACSVIISLIQNLLDRYPTQIKVDETLLLDDRTGRAPLPLNKRHAIIVRLGEKRILTKTLDQLRASLEEDKKATANNQKETDREKAKRKRISGGQDHVRGKHDMNKKSRK